MRALITRDHLSPDNGHWEDVIYNSGYRGQTGRGVNGDLICDRDHYELISLVTVMVTMGPVEERRAHA